MIINPLFCLQVATPDANTVITALSQLDEVLQSEERCYQLAPHVDQLLIVATLQYRLVLNTKMANPNVNKEECIKIYRSLTNCLMVVSLFPWKHNQDLMVYIFFTRALDTHYCYSFAELAARQPLHGRQIYKTT